MSYRLHHNETIYKTVYHGHPYQLPCSIQGKYQQSDYHYQQVEMSYLYYKL